MALNRQPQYDLFNGHALKLARTDTMSMLDWIEEHRNGIGGSSISLLAGVSQYGGPFTVYMQMIEGYTKEETDAMIVGRIIEPSIGELFTYYTGKKIERAPWILADPEYPFLRANIDFWVPEEGVGLETKNASEYVKEKWDDNVVPDEYYMQCQWYMMVTNTPYWYIQVLIGGNKPHHVRIPRSEQVIAAIRQIGIDFWNTHVIPKAMPMPDGSETAKQFLTKLYPDADEAVIVDDKPDEIEELIRQVKDYADEEKRFKSMADEAKNQLAFLLGNAAYGYGREYRVKKTLVSIESRVQEVKAYSYTRFTFAKLKKGR